jgi:hypothetical protein
MLEKIEDMHLLNIARELNDPKGILQ